MQVARIASLALLLVGCRQAPAERVELSDAPRFVRAPAERDLGDRCADVGEARACFGNHPGSVQGVLAVPRPVPKREPMRGWRCCGTGRERVCEDRALDSDAFDCKQQVCTQRHPRMPDDGEWECAEISGAVICRGGAAAAGSVPGPADRGWFCGPRRGAQAERVCIDFSPDRPPVGALGDCRFNYEPGRPRRICRAGTQPALGRACAEAGCPAGSVCAGDRCLPLEPAPACWLDADCGGGVCLFGSCRGAA